MTADLDLAFAAVAERLRNSTVRVDDERGGTGSGIVWPGDNLIVTNAHVVRGRRALIERRDGRRFRAQLLRLDPERDLAVLRVADDELGIRPVAVRESDDLRLGELVLAVGNPLGLVGALSAGVVQRCNARWVVADVRLAPGNSGGPLADAQGHVVGVNSMIAGGLALAVPSAAVVDLLGRRAAVV